jgi:hypothetical protein
VNEQAEPVTLAPKRFRLAVDIEADTLTDLAERLYDITTDLTRGKATAKSVFASPSSRGTLKMWERDDA